MPQINQTHPVSDHKSNKPPFGNPVELACREWRKEPMKRWQIAMQISSCCVLLHTTGTTMAVAVPVPYFHHPSRIQISRKLFSHTLILMNYLMFARLSTETVAKVVVQHPNPIEIDTSTSANDTVLVAAKHRWYIGKSPGIAPRCIERINRNSPRVGGIAGVVRISTIDAGLLHYARIEGKAFGKVTQFMLTTVFAVLRGRWGLVLENWVKLSGTWSKREVYLVIVKVKAAAFAYCWSSGNRWLSSKINSGNRSRSKHRREVGRMFHGTNRFVQDWQTITPSIGTVYIFLTRI